MRTRGYVEIIICDRMIGQATSPDRHSSDEICNRLHHGTIAPQDVASIGIAGTIDQAMS